MAANIVDNELHLPRTGFGGDTILRKSDAIELLGDAIGGGGSEPAGAGLFYKDSLGNVVAVPLLDNNVTSMSPADIVKGSNTTHAVVGQNFTGASEFAFDAGVTVVGSTVSTPTSATIITNGMTNGLVELSASVSGDAEGMALQARVYDAILNPGDGTTPWTNQANVTTGNGTIFKSGGSGGTWDAAGAFGSVPGGSDLRFGFTAGSVALEKAIFGLAASYVDANWSNTQYGIYLGATANSVTAVENGSVGVSLGSYTTGDRFEIIRTGTTMTVTRNGVAIHTFADASSEPTLIAKIALNLGVATHRNIYLKHGVGSNA